MQARDSSLNNLGTRQRKRTPYQNPGNAHVRLSNHIEVSMVTLNFTLTPEAASRVHDLLVCLGKFSETIAIEARPERVS